MTWVQLLALVAYAIVKRFGWVGVAVAGAFEVVKPLVGETLVPSFAAPDELKELIKHYLNQLVDRVGRPLIRLVLQRVVNEYLDQVIDLVWDQLFDQGRVGHEFPREVQHTPVALVYDDEGVPDNIAAAVVGG